MQVPGVSNGKPLYTTRPIPLGKLQEIWAVISGDEIAISFALLSIYLDILCSGTFSLRLKFYRFIFMQKDFHSGWFLKMVSNPGFPHLYTIVLENRKVFFKFTQVPLLILTL